MVTYVPLGQTTVNYQPAPAVVGDFASKNVWGTVDAGQALQRGELVVFAQDSRPIVLQAQGQGNAVFVLGSAVVHPHALHLGNYSVHTSAQALAMGEGRIRELGRKLREEGARKSASGTMAVFK